MAICRPRSLEATLVAYTGVETPALKEWISHNPITTKTLVRLLKALNQRDCEEAQNHMRRLFKTGCTDSIIRQVLDGLKIPHSLQLLMVQVLDSDESPVKFALPNGVQVTAKTVEDCFQFRFDYDGVNIVLERYAPDLWYFLGTLTGDSDPTYPGALFWKYNSERICPWERGATILGLAVMHRLPPSMVPLVFDLDE